MLSFSMPNLPMPTSYLFIDGGNFWKLLDEFSEIFHDGSRLAVDWRAVRSVHRKVYFYDAVPVQGDGEDDNTYGARIAPKLAELHEIERADGFHVRSGDVRHGGRRRGNEQKMVDVQLAVDALQMGSRRLFDTAALLTGDLDFKPLLDALVDLGVDVHLQYPPKVTNDKLIAAADRANGTDPNQIAVWIDKSRVNFELPVPSHNLKHDMENYKGLSIKHWTDNHYGECVIVPMDSGSGYKLVTERSPSHPLTHNLEIASSRLKAIEIFADRMYNLQVPE